ncbi:hypothetical protein [Sorangium atrum]|uniref:Uncharacterized protein n=1 Tax=Sorangium atrum TaxID=2995308 RepID=A0ABT5C1R4_9BACT|nr:hypothetical protein [Sorangium aterium]MDC0680334.1 hypothetical protein [Sorangium aterium]
MAFSSWQTCAAAALLAAACSSTGGSPGTGSAGSAGLGGSGGAGMGGAGGGAGGTGGAGAGGAGGAASSTTAGGGAGGEAVYDCASIGDPCTTCLALRCQESYCACQRSTECAALGNCLLGCAAEDVACKQACMTAHRAGISGIFLEGGCASELCRAQCPSRDALSPCASCRFTGCAAEMNACVADPSCRALLACVELCRADGDGCQEACAAMHADGVQTAGAVFACEEAKCGADCE